MMVLDFAPDAAVLARAQDGYRPEAPDDLIYVFLRLPTWWEIDGVDLFGPVDSHRKPRISVLNVGNSLLFALGRVRDGRVTSFDFEEAAVPGTITLEPLEAGRVRVSNDYSGATAEASVSDIEAAVAGFQLRASAYVLQRIPQLAHDSKWGWWFRNEARPAKWT